MPKDSIYTKTLRARISPSMLQRLDSLAKSQDRTTAEVVRDALREFVRKEEGECDKCGQKKPATEQEAGVRDRKKAVIKPPKAAKPSELDN